MAPVSRTSSSVPRVDRATAGATCVCPKATFTRLSNGCLVAASFSARAAASVTSSMSYDPPWNAAVTRVVPISCAAAVPQIASATSAARLFPRGDRIWNLERERCPIAHPIRFCAGGGWDHVHRFDHPHSAVRQAEANASLRVRPRAQLHRRVRLADGDYLHAADGPLLIEQPQCELVAVAHRVRIP